MFGRVSIAAGHDLVLLGLSTGVLRALSLDTGTPLWERSWPDEGPEDDARPTYVGQPLLYQDRTIVQVGYRTIAFELAGGNTVWQSSTAGSAIIHDDRLVGFDREGYWVVDAANGALVSRRDVRPLAPELDQPGRISATAGGFAILSMPGVIAGLEIETGKPAWLLRYKGDQATILAANGRLFVASDARRLMAFSLPSRGTVARDLAEESAGPAETQVSSSGIVAEIKAGLARGSKVGAGADLKSLNIVQLVQLLLERQIWLDEATPMEEMEAYPLVTEAERELEARGTMGLPGWQWLLAVLRDSGRATADRAAAMLLLRSSPLRQLAGPEIVAALTHSEWPMRHIAILCVRFAGATFPETVQRLRDLADSDPEARVRAAARSTLRRLQPK